MKRWQLASIFGLLCFVIAILAKVTHGNWDVWVLGTMIFGVLALEEADHA